MSFWKKTEYWYIIDEELWGYNCYWWGGHALDNHLGPYNKGLYRTMLRVAKNKKRKLRVIKRRK